MPAAKPVFGYPSMTAAVVALRAQGLSAAAVARRLEISVANVSAFESSARRRISRPIRLPADVAKLAEKPARQRGITVEQLALRIVVTALREGMVDAVLDDEEGTDG